jgi:hypothetical protein
VLVCCKIVNILVDAQVYSQVLTAPNGEKSIAKKCGTKATGKKSVMIPKCTIDTGFFYQER